MDTERAEGRRFSLKLKRNFSARQDALATIRQHPSLGWWQVRIGGRIRGQLLRRTSRKDCEEAVHDHYNQLMVDYVKNRARSLATLRAVDA